MFPNPQLEPDRQNQTARARERGGKQKNSVLPPREQGAGAATRPNMTPSGEKDSSESSKKRTPAEVAAGRVHGGNQCHACFASVQQKHRQVEFTAGISATQLSRSGEHDFDLLAFETGIFQI